MTDAGPQLPPIANAAVSVLLLAPPEKLDLETIVTGWLDEFSKRGTELEALLLVEAGSPAATEAEALRVGQPSLHVIHHVAPSGEGPRLQTGVWLAQHPLIFVVPCDGQFQPTDLALWFAAIDKVHLVAGYRVPGKVPWWVRAWDLCKRLTQRVLLGAAGERCDSWLGWRAYGRGIRAWIQFGTKVRDPECAFRLYRREVFRRIPIQSQGAFAAVEIVAKANHLGRWMTEVPIAWTPAAEVIDAGYHADRRAVFRDPDFGPATLPPEPIRGGVEAPPVIG
jgi:hypothetical protein